MCGFHGLIRIREGDHHCKEVQQKAHYIKSKESQEIQYADAHTCPWKSNSNNNMNNNIVLHFFTIWKSTKFENSSKALSFNF